MWPLAVGLATAIALGFGSPTGLVPALMAPDRLREFLLCCAPVVFVIRARDDSSYLVLVGQHGHDVRVRVSEVCTDPWTLHAESLTRDLLEADDA